MDTDQRIAALEAELERLRGILRQCVRGADVADLGNGEIIGLHLPHKPGTEFTDIKRGLRIASRPHDIAAGTNIGDGIALTSASHPGWPEGDGNG